jgi:hypothetical protein
MEFKGYNGTISVGDRALTITHSGLIAKAGGLVRDKPREIPLQAISGVNLKEASRMANGWLTLGVGGATQPIWALAPLGLTPTPSCSGTRTKTSSRACTNGW